MMKKGKTICFSIGTALLSAALFLVLCNFYQDRKSGEIAQRILPDLKAVITENNTEGVGEPYEAMIQDDLFSEYEASIGHETSEQAVELDGNAYIGIISVPSLEIELPVLSRWSYPDLKISPCRYKGTAAEGDMIIAAHNYRSHFGRLNELSGGEEIIFTDANGKIYRYEVTLVEEIRGTDAESMESGSAENWDLTLFTCTLSGRSRVTVRAVSLIK